MASIVIFPTVATHRKLPHLPPKEPKGPKESNVSNDDHSAGLTQSHSIVRRSSANEDTGVSPSSMSQLTTELGSTATDSTLRLRNGTAQTKAVDLTITTHGNQMRQNEKSTGMLPIDQLPKQEDPERSHEHDDVAQGSHHLSHSTLAILSATSLPPSTLPPSGASLPPSSDYHDSRSIRSTLYDAFGCLYHPVQHTHPSLVASSSISTPTSAGTAFHQIAPCVSSVNHHRRPSTPMIGSSPRDSPALRPHAGGASAPITPLDLSSADGGGYGSSSTTSGPGATSSPRYHFFAHHTHPHPHTNPGRRSSSFHHEEGALHFHETASPNKSRSSRPSLDDHLSPAEHPVLCSLQALSLTHTHLPEYYHPHLGHDLGHDRVPIPDSESHYLAAQTSTASFAQPPPALTPSEQQQHQRPSGGSSPFPMDHGSDDSRVVI